MDKISVFKNKRVLVTGSTGFKGSWLSIWLKKLGADVYGYALKPDSNNCNFNICNLENVIKQGYGDIRHISPLRIAIRNIMPEFIFHLAAQPIVLEALKNPSHTFETNIMGTVNVLDEARKVECLKSIVVVTSDKCYKNTGVTLHEDDGLGGDDPYSASKACEDMVASSFYKSFFKDLGVGLSTARAGNVIGGGDRGKYRIIPDCIKAIENGEDINIRNPKHVRPWQYVLEPLYGYLKLAACMYENPDTYSCGWNFGPNEEAHISVDDLVEMMLVNAHTLYNKTGIVMNVGTGDKNSKEKGMLALDSSRAKDILSVNNILTLQDVCRFTVEDYFCEGNILQQRFDRIEGYEEKIRNGM